MADRKLSPEQLQAAAERFAAGESVASLARELGVAHTTLKKHFLRLGVKPEAVQLSRSKAKDLEEFTSRARMILWRQDSGKERTTYNAWEARVKELEENGNLNRKQAVVQASKGFHCLDPLFRDYDVSEFDPSPNGRGPALANVEIEGREQTYRDNLRFAIEAAGRLLRTNQHPEKCPNDSAFYLYKQAISEPKDFLSRVGQVESKGDADAEEQRLARKSGKRSIDELNSMLDALENPHGE